MRTSEEINELAAALAKAQGAFRLAPRDAQNPHFKNRYTTLAAIWDVIRGPLTENGLSITQVIATNDNGAPTLYTRLMHASGQWIEGTFPIITGDIRGVNPAQAMGSGTAYARRYSLGAIVGVASEDDDDGEGVGTTSSRAPSADGARIVDVSDVKIDFGKHSGKTLGQIVAADPGYVHWLSENAKDGAIRNAAMKILIGPEADRDAIPFELNAKSAVNWAMKHAPGIWPEDKDGVINIHAVRNSLQKLVDSGLSGDALARAWIEKVEKKLAAKNSPSELRPTLSDDMAPPSDWDELVSAYDMGA